MKKPHLFGTDGMRGVAGRFPLDPETVTKTGRALGAVLTMNGRARAPKVVLGEDTRESSAWIARALAAGLRAQAVEVAYAGVITTPGIAYLASQHGFDGGVVISASHNPFEDNGIKILSSEGTKLAESVELEIERRHRTMPGQDVSQHQIVGREEDLSIVELEADPLDPWHDRKREEQRQDPHRVPPPRVLELRPPAAWLPRDALCRCGLDLFDRRHARFSRARVRENEIAEMVATIKKMMIVIALARPKSWPLPVTSATLYV